MVDKLKLYRVPGDDEGADPGHPPKDPPPPPPPPPTGG